MVADIEKYPDFLPWCHAARIIRRPSTHELEAELIISFGHFKESYVSKVQLTPPKGDGEGQIEVDMLQGPFNHLKNIWKFIPAAKSGSEIDFFLDFQFKSKLLDKLIGGMFTQAHRKMVEAFNERADFLYGKGK